MATKYNVGDNVVINMTGAWSFEKYTGTTAIIEEAYETLEDYPYVVRLHDGRRIWLSENQIVRRKRNAK